MRIILFTPKGYENLKKELEKESLKRPEAVKSLVRGREMGDLSENGLYKAAKHELSNIDRNITHLKNLIRYGKPHTPINNDIVQLGHKVKVKMENEVKQYEIVGEYEAKPKENKISIKSPVGHNLMGRKTGDNVKINTPNGQIFLKILKIYS